MSNFQEPVFFKLLIPMILLTGIFVSGNTWAALPGFMRANGETQGEIKGGVTQAGREDSMEVIEFGHNVSALMDATGVARPSGKRQHRPIRIVKDIDKASPILMTVLTQGERLTDVRIDFWRPSSSGKEFQFYTVELVGAYIVSIVQSIGSEGDLLNTPPRETVTLSYDRIIWTWQDGGITAEDDWTTPQP